MTTITLKHDTDEQGRVLFTWIKVNGRHVRIAHRITRIERDRNEWVGETWNGDKFRIFGGRKAGGTIRDWFLQFADWTPIDCTSAVDAINLIETM